MIFREIHDTVLPGAPAPVGNSLYVVSLLLKLRAIGYTDLALEVDKQATQDGHSLDLIRFHEACKQGDCTEGKRYPHDKPGWIGLEKAAIEAGCQIRFIDVADSAEADFHPRDREMFANLKREIFDRDTAAKIIIYVSANHIDEYEKHAGVYLYRGKPRPLGYLLDDFTAGRHFSVYMGHT